MPRFAIRILGPKTDGVPAIKDVTKAPFLERFDFDANEGRGAAYTTKNPKKAMTFPSGSQAFFWYREPSPRKPANWPANQPYVPMSAYSLAIFELEEEEAVVEAPAAEPAQAQPDA